MELAKNQEHTVTIEGYGEGGMGVARIDGHVVFVHGALRGAARTATSAMKRSCG